MHSPEQAGMLIEEVSICHAGEVVADGTLEAVAPAAAGGGFAEEAGVGDIMLENVPEHATGATIDGGNARVVVEIGVEKLPEGSVCGAKFGAVANEGATVAAYGIGGLDATGGYGPSAMGDDVLDLAVDDAADDVGIEVWG